jgi:hypothetical protein
MIEIFYTYFSSVASFIQVVIINLTSKMMEYIQKAKILGLLCLITTLSATLALTTYSGLASAQNKTLMQPTGIKGHEYRPSPWCMG